MTELIRAGKHLYAYCPDCGKLVRQTGFLAGWHICLTEEEIMEERQRRDSNPEGD